MLQVNGYAKPIYDGSNKAADMPSDKLNRKANNRFVLA
jgi:hypothetical protein